VLRRDACGGLIVASHDRYLLENADIFAVRKNI
jgi:ATPase subunit of ABC transporter with duplicated ATPase domains